MNNAYITILSNDNFLYGVVAIYFKLKELSTYKLYCLTTPNISNETCTFLQHTGINTISVDWVSLPELMLRQQVDEQHAAEHSVRTFFIKLRLAELKQFDKIIYLDADTYILQNIDDLFNNTHMSHCMDTYSYYNQDKNWYHLNGGLLVLEPKKMNFDELLDFAFASKDLGFGDESLWMQYYHTKEHTEFILPCYYNCWITEIYNLKQQFWWFNEQNIKMIHMVGEKPWSQPLDYLKLGLEQGQERWRERSEYKLKYIDYINSCIYFLRSKGIEHSQLKILS